MKDSTFEKYCLVVDEWFMNGFNGTKAYQKFYPEATNESAPNRFREIVRISEVFEYRQERLDEMVNEADITIPKQLLRLDFIIDNAEKESDKINALKEQNKLLALYGKHNAQKGGGNLAIQKWIEEKSDD